MNIQRLDNGTTAEQGKRKKEKRLALEAIPVSCNSCPIMICVFYRNPNSLAEKSLFLDTIFAVRNLASVIYNPVYSCLRSPLSKTKRREVVCVCKRRG